MKNNMIPAEVIVHFDTHGTITPHRIRYELDGKKILHVTKLLKRATRREAGRVVEVFECIGCRDDYEFIFVLNFEKKINQWFLTKL